MILHTVLSNGDSFWSVVKTINFDEDGCSYTQVGEEDGYMIYSRYAKPRKDEYIVAAWVYDERSLMVMEQREWATEREEGVDRASPSS